MTFKEVVYRSYRRVLEEKVSAVQQVLTDLQQSGANETKSTAGDKHETALAMLQIEQANKRQQLTQLLEQQALLNRIDPALLHTIVSLGSVIRTDDSFFFISAALGKIVIQGESVFALSAASPLGKQLLGKAAGSAVTQNGKSYLLLAVQ